MARWDERTQSSAVQFVMLTDPLQAVRGGKEATANAILVHTNGRVSFVGTLHGAADALKLSLTAAERDIASTSHVTARLSGKRVRLDEATAPAVCLNRKRSVQPVAAPRE
jgi:hypothetical protein